MTAATPARAASAQRTEGEATRFARMSRDDISAAWWVHVHPARGGSPKTSDPLARPLVKLRMAALGLSDRDCAMTCMRLGLIGADDVSGYR